MKVITDGDYMNNKKITAIILAAGQGKRMNDCLWQNNFFT